MFSTNMKLILTAIIIVTAAGFAASTKEIDEVRKKTDLTDGDLAVVDSFINDTFKEMLESPTVADSVKRREDILVRKPKDEQPKYKEQFRKSIESNVDYALKTIGTWNDESFIKATRLNIAVIIGSLDDIALCDTAIGLFDEESVAVKYWAAKALTGKDVTAYVKANPSDASSRAVIGQMKKLASMDSPAMLMMVSAFAASIGGADSYELLAAVATVRIDAYNSGHAANESTDARIMAIIANKLSADTASKAALASPFAQLMSCALRKFSLSLIPEAGLDEVSQQQLVTVVAELEKTILPKFSINTNLIKSVERKNIKDYTEAYNNLFGAQGDGGELAAKLGVQVKVEPLIKQ